MVEMRSFSLALMWSLAACGPTPPNTTSAASRDAASTSGAVLSLRVLGDDGIASPTVTSDGVDFALIEVTATRPDGAPWQGEVALSTDRGAFGRGLLVSLQQMTTDSNGRVAVEFTCLQPATGTPEPPVVAQVTASIDGATATTALFCVAGPERRTLVVTSNTSVHLYADGFTETLLTATARNRRGEPQQGAAITFSVGTDLGRLCPVEASPCAIEVLSTAQTAATDANGVARVMIKAPQSPGTVLVVATWDNPNEVTNMTSAMPIEFGLDRSGITLSASRSIMAANGISMAQFTGTARGLDGLPAAAGTRITFRVNEPYLIGDPPTSVTVVRTSDASGRATVALAPTIWVGRAEVVASFEVAPGQPRNSGIASVAVTQPGRLVLSASAEPMEFYSDDYERAYITATVTSDGETLGGETVHFELDTAGSAIASFSANSLLHNVYLSTDAAGKAAVELSAAYPGAVGTGTVRITCVLGSSVVQTWLPVTLRRHPLLARFEYVRAEPTAIGVRGSSLPQTARVTFRASNDSGQPMAGISVRFPRPISIDALATVLTAGGGDITTTDAAGEAVAELSAGFQARPVKVTAVATDPRLGYSYEASTPEISVLSDVPAWDHSGFVCDPTQATISSHGSRHCQVLLADQTSQPIAGGAAVQFMTESGLITSTPDAANGAIINVVFHAGEPAPIDTHDAMGMSGTRNPLDRLVSHVAFSMGAEAFADANGNGIYDDNVELYGDSEPFIDLPEPMLDKQDDCFRNEATNPSDPYFVNATGATGLPDPALVIAYTDPFFDSNNDGGAWGGSYQQHDALTTIWWQQWTLYTGPATGLQLVDLACPAGDPVSDRCNTASHVPWLSSGELVRLRFRAVDDFGNCPSPGVAGRYRVEVANGAGGGEYSVGSAGCGLDTGAHPSWYGLSQPWCTTHRDLVLDSNLVLSADGVGSHPFEVAIDTTTSRRGVPIIVTITYEGIDDADQPMETRVLARFVVPCAIGEDGAHDDCPAPLHCAPVTRVCVE